jgi:hypothetical protein
VAAGPSWCFFFKFINVFFLIVINFFSFHKLCYCR